MTNTKRIYLDYAASTPIAPEALRAMQPYFSERFGNPGSLHVLGQEAIAAMDDAREKIAIALGLEALAGFRQIVFTGSATEANNLALRGVVEKSRSAIQHLEIIISAIEHESVFETARLLQAHGATARIIPVNKEGVINLQKLRNTLTKNTVFVSMMYANNEIGTIEPIVEIAKIIKEWKENAGHKNPYPLLHTDAAQAFQFLPCAVEELGVDFMTISGHKIYGPKGIGALYVKNIRSIEPVITGGGQEFGLRSGTENIPSIVGFGKAVERAHALRLNEARRIAALRDYFWEQIKKIYPRAQLNGSSRHRLPNILNIAFPGWSAQDLLVRFDRVGVAISLGSACSARSLGASHVLIACGLSKEKIQSSVRFSLGRNTTEKELIEAVKRMKSVFE